MPEVKMSVCNRDNWCVDCDYEKCWHHGDIATDCPKWKCDNHFDCWNCDFIKELYKEMHGGKEWQK